MTEKASASPQSIWYQYVDLTHRYADAADQARGSAVAELFTADGTWDGTAFGLAVLHGHAAIGEHFDVADPNTTSAHLVTNHRLVEVGPTAVTACSYAHAILRRETHVRQIVVRYDDILTCTDGWRFATRVLGRVTSFTQDTNQTGVQR